MTISTPADVSYLTPELAEIAFPDDVAEDLFAKASEYLESGCREVWLVFPESRRILIIIPERTLAFAAGDRVSTQVMLAGFGISVDEFLA